jgi:hypothetical protein
MVYLPESSAHEYGCQIVGMDFFFDARGFETPDDSTIHSMLGSLAKKSMRQRS